MLFYLLQSKFLKPMKYNSNSSEQFYNITCDNSLSQRYMKNTKTKNDGSVIVPSRAVNQHHDHWWAPLSLWAFLPISWWMSLSSGRRHVIITHLWKKKGDLLCTRFWIDTSLWHLHVPVYVYAMWHQCLDKKKNSTQNTMKERWLDVVMQNNHETIASPRVSAAMSFRLPSCHQTHD